VHSDSRVAKYGSRRVMLILFPLAAVCLVAACVATASAVTAQGKSVTAITASSSSADVVEFMQAAPRWDRIEIQGHTIFGATKADFKVYADNETGCFKSVDGDLVTGRDATGQYRASLKAGQVHAFPTPPQVPSDDQQAALDTRLDSAAALDPTVRRADEASLNSRFSDMIYPSAWIRSELGVVAQKVENVGTQTVAGREAIHLRVEFPRGLAKEDHWDLYIDAQTGVVLGLVVTPTAGAPGYEEWIDSISVNPSIGNAVCSRTSNF
jgi:hypothetical protein